MGALTAVHVCDLLVFLLLGLSTACYGAITLANNTDVCTLGRPIIVRTFSEILTITCAAVAARVVDGNSTVDNNGHDT